MQCLIYCHLIGIHFLEHSMTCPYFDQYPRSRKHIMSKYSEERAFPSSPLCGKSHLTLTFNGRTIRAVGTKAPLQFRAVSGKPDPTGRFDYSAERQRIPNQGPIPAGRYWIQPSQLWENNWFKSALRAPRGAWGNFRLTIHPYPGTQTHGRGGFFIHGGTSPGSAGCIDLVQHIDRFVERIKQELGGLPECYIPLTVRY